MASENGGLTSTTDSSQKIAYTIKSAESDTAAVTTFEFTAAEINKSGGTSKPIGVNVEDYSGKSAGDYEDEITYNVEVQDVVPENADKLTQTTHNGTSWSCFVDNAFIGKNLTTAQGFSLAQYQAGQIGNKCAVIVGKDWDDDSSMVYARSDSDATNTFHSPITQSPEEAGLTGYTVYYVAN